MNLTENERLAWWRLSRTENIGPITFFRLIERYGTASSALDALPDMAKRGGRKTPFVAFDDNRAKQELSALSKIGARVIAACEDDYPASLREIDDAPPLLTVLGDVKILSRPAIGIVGARNASLSGRKMAQMIARDLGAAGYSVISGLARGIDTAAHEGSLPYGTVAVVAGGVDNIYPPENAPLYKEILARGGAIVSEHPAGLEPIAAHFPRRNRIISGLTSGTLVVEATLKSGSLITARFAGEQGRDVFAVPGSPLDPRAAGPNQLIRDGAVLIENAAQIMSHVTLFKSGKNLAESNGNAFAADPAPVDQVTREQIRQTIYDNLSPTPVLVDEVVRACHLSTHMVQTVLLEMELAGHVQRLPGNRIALIFKEENIERQRPGYS